MKLTTFLLSSLEVASGGKVLVSSAHMTGCRLVTGTVWSPSREMALPALASQVAMAFWFLMACSVPKGQTIESPQPLAFFLGAKPGSSSPEQLVPGTLTVLSPRKKSLF